MEREHNKPQPDLDEYFALREEGSYREAYAVLRAVMETQSRWSRAGDLYVWCADLELVVNDDVPRARALLKKARKFGCLDMAVYHSVHGYVLWRSGRRKGGIRELEKSVAIKPTTRNLASLATILSTENDKHAAAIWQRVLEQNPKHCIAHVYLGFDAAKAGDGGRAWLMAKRAERLAATAQESREIGRLYYELGEHELAIGAYLRAESLGYTPKGPLYASVALCHYALGDRATARKFLEWAIQHDPQHEHVRTVYEQMRDLMIDQGRDSIGKPD